MSKRFLVSLFLSLVSSGAHAVEIDCGKLPHARCQQIIDKALATNDQGGERVSSIGTIFTRDTSKPALGEAYRDPSGLIWGSIVRLEGKVNKMVQRDAESYCISSGARLPTRSDVYQLEKFLGEGTTTGYSPFLVDGITEVLPDFTTQWIWLSEREGYGGSYGTAFLGSRQFQPLISTLNPHAFRCVAPR